VNWFGRVKFVFGSSLALITTGCFGSITPLAPGLSGSVGLPANGILTDATELPKSGPGFVRYRIYGDRNYGTPNLVNAIRQAALRVQQDAGPCPPLVVGDLSSRFGGKISRHASHRSGRDVDLLFYTTTLGQTPVTAPGFVHFGSDSLARLPDGRFVALDIRRQWFLTRAFLTNPNVEILWMFVSRDVEAYLINYALSIGEPPELLLKAARVLHQPRDSASHDDHLHLRIACSQEERVAGCESGGPTWPWLSQPTSSNDINLYLPWDSDDDTPFTTELSQVHALHSLFVVE
jgi:penicillin-insensitive murein endopeptidase